VYFKKASWEAAWIKAAEALVCNVFKWLYENAETEPDVDEVELAARETSKNMFDELEALAAPKASELHGKINQYLSTNIEDVHNALKWWSQRRLMFQCYLGWHSTI
jgi:hypothetical protein